jgi:predicted short-subunit dehydrogenase-like oxidoreductase (DUF2520 family)
MIGAGNLATRLGIELADKGHEIVQVYSRTEKSARELAEKIGAKFTSNIDSIDEGAELYLFAVKDDALESILCQLKPNKGLWVHTAGSIPVQIFESFTTNFGSFYPLQTFSKNRMLDFSIIPIYIEGSTPEITLKLRKLGESISRNVLEVNSDQRMQLHLAAVFACNFTNRMYAIAAELLKEKGLDFKHLLPLIDETAQKVHELQPLDAQTGPAIRFDQNIINNHIHLLRDGELKHLYYALSENIFHNSNQFGK